MRKRTAKTGDRHGGEVIFDIFLPCKFEWISKEKDNDNDLKFA